jgi:hypothetical protein
MNPKIAGKLSLAQQQFTSSQARLGGTLEQDAKNQFAADPALSG